jgi:hypothetical protein
MTTGLSNVRGKRLLNIMKHNNIGLLSVALGSCFVLIMTTCSTGPGEEQRLWALATTGILTEYNRERHDILEGVERTKENITKHKILLNYWWGIDSREDLLFLLEWLEQIGHRKRFGEMGQYMNTLAKEEFNRMLRGLNKEDRSSWEIVLNHWARLGKKSLIGWDYCRYIHLCRRGYLLGYLNETETWNLIMPKAHLLQATFDSWRDLGENYIIGREFWSFERTEASGEFFHEAYEKLMNDQASPWNTIPWDLDLR